MIERQYLIGICNLVASIFSMYWSWLYGQNAWWSNAQATMSLVGFSLALLNLICFAYSFKVFDLSMEEFEINVKGKHQIKNRK